eukprot:78007-Pelagomonas_calceolata.AAC.1
MDIVEGGPKRMKIALAKDGTQSHVQGRATPADLFKRLTKGGQKAWNDQFVAKIQPECGGLCVLECKQCKADLSPANPAETRRRHVCKASALAAAGVDSSSRKQAREQEQEEEVDCIGQPKPKKHKMSAFSVSPSQHKQFHRLFAIHIIKAEVPFSKVECPALR